MKHYAPTDFMATPQRGRGRTTEADMTRMLIQRFQPTERARSEAQRLDSDPRAMAEAFASEVDHSRSEHHAVVRSEALAAIVANTDAVGALTISIPPEEVSHRVQDAEIALDRVFTERRKSAEKAKETWRQGVAAFNAWADRSGAKLRSAPWPTSAYFALVVTLAALAETWLVSQVLHGPPIVDVPPPLVLGLIFAGGSLFIGSLAALGHMLAADARALHRLAGWGVLALTLVAWAILCLTGAHMRATIEAGGSGTGPEILASIHEGLFEPLVSPLALLLAAASTATAVAMWLKTIGYFGTPFGHRWKDNERRWCQHQLHNAEEAHKTEIRSTVAVAGASLELLETVAWKPANDARQLEREVLLIIAQARESEKAIQRAHNGQLTAYSNTFQRVRPGAEVSALFTSSPMSEEALGDPKTLRNQVEQLERAAGDVSGAVNKGKLRLHAAEVAHLTKVDALYADTRGRGAGQALLTD